MKATNTLITIIFTLIIANAVSAECTENWICGDWSDCANTIQRRVCADQNQCETENLKPPTEKTCSAQLYEQLAPPGLPPIPTAPEAPATPKFELQSGYADSTDIATDESDATQYETTTETTDTLTLIIVIIVVLIAAAGITVGVIYFKRERKAKKVSEYLEQNKEYLNAAKQELINAGWPSELIEKEASKLL